MVDREEIKQYADYHGIELEDVIICNECAYYESIDNKSGVCYMFESENIITNVDSDCFCKWGERKGGE